MAGDIVDTVVCAGGLEAAASASGLRLFVDFDGTLSEIVARPADAVPLPESMAALAALVGTGVRVAIVSGRSLDDLVARAVLPGAWLVGQHGGELMDPLGRHDQIVRDAEARPHLERYARTARQIGAAEGLLVEDKGLAVAVHYRGLAAEAALRVVENLRVCADEATSKGVAVWTAGKCVVELRARGADKGFAVRHLLERWGPSGACIAIGDDVTDEDMFHEVLWRGGLAMKVGEGPTAAPYRVAGPAELASWLRRLAEKRMLFYGVRPDSDV